MIWLRFLGFAFSALAILILASAGVLGIEISDITRDLPDYRQLADYEPPIMTRVYAADGSILAEYAKQRRLFLPFQLIPKTLINAFLAAEDGDFYSNPGVDPWGVVRAAITNLRNWGHNRRPMGASTITQQVVKNFFLNNEVSYRRKLEEAILALRLNQTYSKDKILELYLNQIYLGSGNYGVAAASLGYFGRPVRDLSIAQMAYLAALPKAPNNFDPLRNHDAALARRNWVIGRMEHEGFITTDQAAEAVDAPLGASTHRSWPDDGNGAAYFAEDVRQQLNERYGSTQLYQGGMAVLSTLNRHLQALAHQALVDGLVKWDEREGYRGPLDNVTPGPDWHKSLAAQQRPDDVAPWRLAIVLDVRPDRALIGLQQTPRTGASHHSNRVDTGIVKLKGVAWAHWAIGPLKGRRVTQVSNVLKTGDIIYVEPSTDDDGTFDLRQIPDISGAVLAMDPATGRVLAMDGGFSFQYSSFNRATQAFRQPGSSFKPFIYAAALDDGYTPSTIVSDDPISIDPGDGQPIWNPANDGDKYYGPRPLRFGLERSRNVMTVRIAQDIGMPLISRYAQRFGIYDSLPPYIAMSLGSGTTTLMRMVTAYAMLANGGIRIKPTEVEDIKDRNGQTIYRHDERLCPTCNSSVWAGQPEPPLIDNSEQILDPSTAYQVTSMLEGVVQRGTATVLKFLDRPIAGKTGTTNDSKDVWFIGYSPSLVAGVYLGYDAPRSLGKSATGGRVAAPIFGQFMQAALAGTPSQQFRIPLGIKLVVVDQRSGRRTSNSDAALFEAFKVGTSPPDNTDNSKNYATEGHGIAFGTGRLY
ncbi:penicillin-binding protein 1A [Labrys okinawensis]|uniref:penicillin-binding protein 1A n=1 Tax=Labrys okinawensis TaxID=346911 RepID=UPI0039BC5272